MTYSGGGRSSNPSETKQDLTGTVIDPSGLTVLALSSVDPAELYRRMSDEYNKIETQVNDVKILLDDGTEMPAEIVLRDKDLDLAFIRPKTKPASPMAAVDLSKSAPVEMLEPVIALNRLNRAAGRAYSASVERIDAVIQKPRTFYIPDSRPKLGHARLAGLCPQREHRGDLCHARGQRGRQRRPQCRENMTAILLPAEDILKGAKQAPEAKGDADKPAAATEAKDAKEQK